MAVDSIGDVLSSAAILASVLVGHFFSINLDGYMGVVVSVIIFIGGFKVLKETFNSLLGAAPTPEEVACIKSKLLSFDGILGIHDLVIHNYGPQKRFVTVHAEVDASMSVMTAHELADRIERDFMQNAHTVMLVHIDPIVTDDDYTDMIKAKIIKTLDQKIGEIEIHDFRVVYGKRNRVLFDYVLSYGNKMQPSEVESILNDCVDCTVDYCVTIDFK
jgi:Co/Zn/Cd efflux system component